ncbi:PorV/PorQ family protein [Candidatus Dependentiae bacterium]|nr:PorV/PorQ family protein [Candidatus Dependentiae bacterium]
MKKFRIFFLLLTILAFSSSVFASSDVGTTGAAFLKIDIGARPAGLGDCFVGIADDYNAIQWNPAGLSFLEKGQVAFIRTNWLADTSFNALSFAYPFNFGTLGFNWTSLNYGSIDGYDIYGNSTGSFTPTDTAITLSYSKEITKGFSLGLNLKQISSKIESETASTQAFDFGLLYKLEIAGNPFKLGFSVLNMGGEMKFIEEGDPLPTNYLFGFSYLILNNDTHSVLGAIDLSKPVDNDFRANLGVEYGFKQMLFIRLGYKAAGYDIEGLAAGFGFHYPLGKNIFGFDYAFGKMDEINDVHRFSVSFQF